MFCGHCGSQVDDGTKFCGVCGNPLSEERDAAGSVDSMAEELAAWKVAEKVKSPASQQTSPATPPLPVGQPVNPTMQAPQAPVPQQVAVVQQTSPMPPKKKKSHGKAIGICAAVAVAAVAAVAAVFFFVGGMPLSYSPEVQQALDESASLAAEIEEQVNEILSYESKYVNGDEGVVEELEKSKISFRDKLDSHIEDIGKYLGVIENGITSESGDKAQNLKIAKSALANIFDSLKFQRSIDDVVSSATFDEDDVDSIVSYIETISEGYSKLDPPANSKSSIENVLNQCTLVYQVLNYIMKSSNSNGKVNKLDEYSAVQLMNWIVSSEKQNDYTYEKTLVLQIRQAADVLKDISEGRKVEPGVRIEDSDIEMIGDLYPNLYPNLDSAANVCVYAIGEDQQIDVHADIDGFTQDYDQKINLEPGLNYLNIKPQAKTDLTASGLNDAVDTQFNLTIKDKNGDELIKHSDSLKRHSLYDFKATSDEFGELSYYEILGWMRPESEQVSEINRRAISVLEKNKVGNTLAGYQPVISESFAKAKYNTLQYWKMNTLAQIMAIQQAISDSGVRYKMDSYTATGDQHILTADQVVEQKSGLCVESSLLMASCIQATGMHPVIILRPGHCQVAVEAKRGSGEYFLIETTAIPYKFNDPSVIASSNGQYVNSTQTLSDYLDSYKDSENRELYGNSVFVIDCDLRKQELMDITGLPVK